jgi:GrpB-like predicted nucleotidyltransferase (UPF0157 family)
MNPNHDLSTGYRKPPQHTRWKKGTSGNPKGRPRRPLPINDLVLALSTAENDTVYITVAGKRVKTTLLNALVMRIVRDAVAGKPEAIKAYMTVKRFCERLNRNSKHSRPSLAELEKWNAELEKELGIEPGAPIPEM